MLLWPRIDDRDELLGIIGGRPLRRFPLTPAENCLLSSGSSRGKGSGSAIWTASENLLAKSLAQNA